MDKARKPAQDRDGEMKERQALNKQANKQRKWKQQKDQNKGGGF
ncbi:MAG TPA: hypothetical protein VFK44_15070 [Bacillales bacterium]|nr:hypothetical protein [Bacillales bacterium]